jgi:hypothetical protein
MVTIAPNSFAINERMGDNTVGAAHHLLVLEQLAVDQLSSAGIVPVTQRLRIDHGDIRLIAQFQSTHIQPKKRSGLAGESFHDSRHSFQLLLLSELQGVQVGIEKRHISDVRARVIKSRQGVLM